MENIKEICENCRPIKYLVTDIRYGTSPCHYCIHCPDLEDNFNPKDDNPDMEIDLDI